MLGLAVPHIEPASGDQRGASLARPLVPIADRLRDGNDGTLAVPCALPVTVVTLAGPRVNP